jgi:lysozyme family protein
MYPAAFTKALAFVLFWEGSDYEDDPHDPGGATHFGIDAESDSEWLPLGVTIKELNLAQANRIYWGKYWLGSNCDWMPSPVDMVHFNYSVNVGPSRSVKFMQEVLNVRDDGVLGPVTRKAILSFTPLTLAMGIINEADVYYHMLTSEKEYLSGWLNRNNALRKAIQA